MNDPPIAVIFCQVVLDAEPELSIAFVVTDAMVGTVLNFRKYVTQMLRPE